MNMKQMELAFNMLPQPVKNKIYMGLALLALFLLLIFLLGYWAGYDAANYKCYTETLKNYTFLMGLG